QGGSTPTFVAFQRSSAQVLSASIFSATAFCMLVSSLKCSGCCCAFATCCWAVSIAFAASKHHSTSVGDSPGVSAADFNRLGSSDMILPDMNVNHGSSIKFV